MCGIAGVFAYGDAAPPVDVEELVRVRDAMAARGPDGAGLWVDGDRRIGLAHRRLAILDLTDSGAQPMSTADGQSCITFNGEIYNYLELKKELERAGYRFRSTSDTEVLLHLYAERGPDMVHHLRGMFAFAIWDARRRGVFLARDPFGMKPLYYADNGRCLRFASQVKALLKSPAVDTAPESAGHVGFFLWGHVPEPYTLYKGIRALGAGSSLWIGADEKKQRRQFFRIGEELAAASATVGPASSEEIHERLRGALLSTVRQHLSGDVPVGIFLSAGIDSGTITALATEVSHQPLHTITLGFKEFEGTRHDEVPLAEKVARQYGTLHQTRWITKVEFLGSREGLLDAMDQPSIDGINTYLVSKAAAESGLKVALSGLGADELFGGYPSFRQLPGIVNSLRPLRPLPWIGKGFRYLSAPILKHFTSPKYAGILEFGGTYGGAYLLRRGMFMPWELPTLLPAEMVRTGWEELATLSRLEHTTEGLKDSHFKVTALETSWYMRNQLLRDADWASMAHSLEVRAPFVDVELFRASLPLLRAIGAGAKLAVAKVAEPALPTVITRRPKTGFAIPTRQWLVGAPSAAGAERGPRGWAKQVHPPPARHGSRILSLVTEAFGGPGGIALYNRDFLTAVCSSPIVAEVVAFPRHTHDSSTELPLKLDYRTESGGSKLRYAGAVLRYAVRRPHVDLVICGHMHLLPLAYLLRLWLRAPLLLQVFGIEAWRQRRSHAANYLAAKVDAVTAISETTRDRFVRWSNCAQAKVFILPNAIRTDLYGMRPRSTALLTRYGLAGKVVLLTLGRMDARERYKGFDEVLEVLTELSQSIPNISYLIVGDGNDRHRLEAKAKALRIDDRVVFAGAISDDEKADHYRLADVYVMPSSGEGFGYVFLEAAACGIPVVASKIDGSREALRNGEWGSVVDPREPAELINAIKDALLSKRAIPQGLHDFSYDSFQVKTHRIIADVLRDSRRSKGSTDSALSVPSVHETGA